MNKADVEHMVMALTRRGVATSDIAHNLGIGTRRIQRIRARLGHQPPTTPTPTRRGDEWRDHAACRDHHPDLWFPTGNTPTDLARTNRAIDICHTCPVLAQCREHALTRPETDGTWGGLTAEDRHYLLRSRR